LLLAGYIVEDQPRNEFGKKVSRFLRHSFFVLSDLLDLLRARGVQEKTELKGIVIDSPHSVPNTPFISHVFLNVLRFNVKDIFDQQGMEYCDIKGTIFLAMVSQ
jgi:hypothetical protein